MRDLDPRLLIPAQNLNVALSPAGFFDAMQMARESLKTQLRMEALLEQQNRLLERIALGIEHQNEVSAAPKRRRKAAV